MRFLLILSVLFLITACGGGGGGGSSMPPVVQVPTPSDAKTIENTHAIDPLPSFKAVQLPTSSAFDYRKQADGLTLEMTPYIAPGFDGPDDTLAMVRRSFKVWTRRIDTLIGQPQPHSSIPHREPGLNDEVHVDVLLGYPQIPGGSLAGANHYGDSSLEPLGRSSRQPVVIFHQEFFDHNAYTRDNKLTADGFRVLAHEAGHIFDFTAPDGHYHSDCDGDGIMCDRWIFRNELDPVGPAEQDFDGITHHYSLKEPSDHEVFGIWAAVRNENSSLNEFGVRVTRTLIANEVLSNNRTTTEGFIEDRIRIETMIDGTASTDITYPTNTGTATWNGDLIAVDTQRFTPVLGDATLTMDLSNTDLLQARFTLDGTRYHNDGSISVTESLPFGYTLMRSDDTWLDEQGRVDARFYAIGNDDTAAVAGRLDDESIHLMGAYGALREDVMVPPPPELPTPPVGPEG